MELRESRILAENHVLPRVLSCSEANGCGSSGGRVHGETERPSDRATGECWGRHGRGGWLKRVPARSL
jgi:hypothetical protein